jgi:hypothetical protein
MKKLQRVGTEGKVRICLYNGNYPSPKTTVSVFISLLGNIKTYFALVIPKKMSAIVALASRAQKKWFIGLRKHRAYITTEEPMLTVAIIN